MPHRHSPDSLTTASFWPEAAQALNHDAEIAERRLRRKERAIATIPRLRAIGYAGLFCLIAIHNELVFADLLLGPLLFFGLCEIGYFAVSKFALVTFYNPDAKRDLSDVFLAGDIAIFVLAVYASGGERSFLLPVLCMRVADQVGTSPKRTRAFGIITAILQSLLVLYLAFVEHRALMLSAEFAKVLSVCALNFYLALATAPGERQRERSMRTAQTMRELIVELQRRGEELQVQRERAESASRAKTAFLANMSHEIRTPLTAVLGMTDLLLHQELEPAHREIVETVQLAGKSLHALVNDVLDMSKVESGKLELSLSSVELRPLVKDAVEPLRVLAEGKGLELNVELHNLPERKVRADALRLRQVLSNLVSNAIKFTQSGSVSVRLAAREVSDRPRSTPLPAPSVAGSGRSVGSMPASHGGVRVHFSVRDTGIGIPKEAAERVFEAFQQADASTTRNYGGTGLGLTISRKLVEMMGGELTLTSVPGEGSCFEFELSLLYVVDSLRPATTADRAQHAARLRALRPHVLVVEDVEVNRLLLQEVLKLLGCRVTVAEDGGIAVNALQTDHDFAVVLMDWHMPVVDGLEATARVRAFEHVQRKPRVPIIGFTASAFADDVTACMQAGMDLVLHKPLVRAQLEEALWSCLGITAAEEPATVA